MSHQPNRRYEFGEFRLDVAERLLERQGVPLPLQPKLFDLLLALVERPGRLIGKDELLAVVWPDAIVEEVNLSNNISILRKILGGKAGHIIETVPRHGYRFVLPVREDARTSEPPIERASQPLEPPRLEKSGWSKKRRWALGLFTVAFLAILFLVIKGMRDRRPSGPGPIHSIAVTPVRSLSDQNRDPATELGLANSLILRLSGLREVVVRPLSLMQQYAGKEFDPISVGREQQVDAVLEGHFQQSGDRIRMTARLIRVEDGVTIWSGKFDAMFSDLFTVQDSITEQAAVSLSLHLTNAELKSLQKRETENLEAYQLYSKGRYHLEKRIQIEYKKAIEIFKQAIAVEPNYALAWAGLADAYRSLAISTSPRQLMPKAKEAIMKALELDNRLPEAYSTLAMINAYYDWDPQAAVQNHIQAIALNPRLPMAHEHFAISSMRSGRFDLALQQIEEALRLAPASLLYHRDKAQILYHARKYDAAIEQCRRTLELDPNYLQINIWLARSYEALGEIEKAMPFYYKSAQLGGFLPGELAAQRIAYERGGWKAYWRKRLRSLEAAADRGGHIDAYQFAVLHLRVGETDKAFEYFDKAYREKYNFIYFKIDPLLDGVQQDPRYQDLLRRVNLSN